MAEEAVEALVTGGSATGGPPLGPALGPLGVNIGLVVSKINEETAAFDGLKVPVTVWVNKETKEFRIEVKTPMTSALIIRELGIDKGSSEPNTDKVGDLSLQQVATIAKMKKSNMAVASFPAAVKTVLGTMVSMGVTVNGGMDPRIVQDMIDDGEFKDILEADD